MAGILTWVLVAALFGLAAYFAALATGQDSRLTLLRERGVQVEATVTGCTAVSSGIGMGVEYWNCRASYSLDGRSFTATLGGNRRLIDAGTKVPAVAVPGHSGLLSTVSAARQGHSSTAEYTIAGLLGGAGVLGGAGRVLLARRRPHTG